LDAGRGLCGIQSQALSHWEYPKRSLELVSETTKPVDPKAEIDPRVTGWRAEFQVKHSP
jgi:hypothetical protein